MLTKNVVVLGSLLPDAMEALREVYGEEVDIEHVDPEFDSGELGPGISAEQVQRLSADAEVWVGEEWDFVEEDKPLRGVQSAQIFFSQLLPLVASGQTFGFVQRDWAWADGALMGLYRVQAGRAERIHRG